jgi:hypothetical protein
MAVNVLEMRRRLIASQPHVETVSGAVATFIGERFPLKSCKASIDPVHDLHGYEHPWPAGNGVNILDPNIKFTTQTVRGVTLTTTDGYNYSISGTGESGSGTLQTNTIPTADCIVYPAGTYTITGMIAGTYHTDGSWYSNRGGTFTSPEDFIIRNGYREIATGTTYNVNEFISMTKGTTAPTSWTPYSNICPITGWTGAKVTVSPTTDEADGTTYSITFPAEAGTVYSGTLDVTTGLLTADMAMADLGELAYWFKDTKRPGVFFSSASAGLRKTSGFCACSEYKWRNEGVPSPGNLSLADNTISLYPSYGGGYIFVVDIAKAELTAEQFKTAMSGVQFCYELATPVTYQLTPQEITTLIGTNNVWADTGNVSVTYWKH